jgi:large-conductance mechanosensitive channel
MIQVVFWLKKLKDCYFFFLFFLVTFRLLKTMKKVHELEATKKALAAQTKKVEQEAEQLRKIEDLLKKSLAELRRDEVEIRQHLSEQQQ